MPNERRRETSLYGPVKRLLEKRGFAVKGRSVAARLLRM
jgi:hypothetical protein